MKRRIRYAILEFIILFSVLVLIGFSSILFI